MLFRLEKHDAQKQQFCCICLIHVVTWMTFILWCICPLCMPHDTCGISQTFYRIVTLPPKAGLIVKSWSSILSSCSDFVTGDFVMSGLLLKIGLWNKKKWQNKTFRIWRDLQISFAIFESIFQSITNLPGLWGTPSVFDVSLLDL